MRIVLFGNSGSGKSTRASVLARSYGLPHLDLDSIVWEPGQIAVPRAAQTVALDLQNFVARFPTWVIEGCYGDLVATAAQSATELVFLNPGREACLAHNLSRPWEPHKYATAEAQNAMLEPLQAWVAGYYHRSDECSLQRHRQIFDAHTGRKTEYTGDPGPPPS